MLLVLGASAAAGVASFRQTGAGAVKGAAPTAGATAPPVDFRYDDGILERGSERWSLGQGGDLVTVGDWDCDGEATPAVLRPATGAVYALASWAAEGSDVRGEFVGSVSNAVDLHAADADADGCDDLVVGDTHGDTTVLHARTVP
jgi:hypothetical protein